MRVANATSKLPAHRDLVGHHVAVVEQMVWVRRKPVQDPLTPELIGDLVITQRVAPATIGRVGVRGMLTS